jgi:hypothetical protein
MKTSVSIFVLLLSFMAAWGQTTKPGSKFVKLWETGPGLKVPESVLYDASDGIIYVSNIDGISSAKDGSGFISTISADGKILNAGWVTGIDAPKGMGILNNHLFVSNIDEIIEIDIRTAKIITRYHADGSTFLNDIATDPKSGKVFISDSKTGQIYVWQNGKVSVWQQGDMFTGANGLFLLDNFLYVGTGNSILRCDIKSGEAKISVPNTGGVDGLYVTPDGKFIFSDWKGSVFIATKDSKPDLLLNTSAQNINAADFGVIVSKQMILIPTFNDNKVVCYTLADIKF